MTIIYTRDDRMIDVSLWGATWEVGYRQDDHPDLPWFVRLHTIDGTYDVGLFDRKRDAQDHAAVIRRVQWETVG